MSKKPTFLVIAAVAPLAAALSLAAGCGNSDLPAEVTSAKTTAAQSAQHVAVSTRDTELVVKGAGSLHAGFVRLEVRNTGRGEHGIALVRLKRPLTTPQLVRAFGAEKRELLESLGGVQQVVPGHPWAMTEQLGPGSYALLDFAQDGPEPNYVRGMYKRFVVAATQARSVSPATVGEIDMRDFRFDFRLPNGFSGRGVVKITNASRTSHEISLVRIKPGHSQREVLNLILSGATKPPEWASIVELLSVLDPAKTAYVKFDLSAGRYLALCLVNEPGSQTLHAQLGMMGSFDVT
jgi:hypothetical protein